MSTCSFCACFVSVIVFAMDRYKLHGLSRSRGRLTSDAVFFLFFVGVGNSLSRAMMTMLALALQPSVRGQNFRVYDGRGL